MLKTPGPMMISIMYWGALLLVVVALVMMQEEIAVMAADPDPLVDFAKPFGDEGPPPPSSGGDSVDGQGDEKLSPGGFILKDVFKNGDVSRGPGGIRAALSTKLFPGITGQGITYVQFKMKPCGVNLPHTHPRAGEMLTLISGGPLQVGFVDTTGKSHVDILKPGDVTIFPRGLMHFELNVGTETAFFISALNSENPGTLTSGNALFKLPKRAIAASLNQEFDMVDKIENNIFDYGHELKLASACTPGKDVSIDI